MSVAVVIPTFNRRDLLAASVTAVLGDTATAEVVVVDDGSSDGTREWVARRAAAEPRLTLVDLGGRGPAHARQAGIEAASAPVVLLLDDDVTPVPGLVDGHAARLAGRDDVVVLGYTPSVLGGERRAGDVAERAYARDYERHCARWEAGEPVLDALWAGNLSLLRERALAIGFTSDDYQERFAVHEDRDFGLRCAAAGMRGVFDRALRGEHHYRRSTRRAAIDATRRSAGTMRLHDAHPGLGRFDPGQYWHGVPPRARPVLRALARDPVGGALLEGQVRVVDGLSRAGAAGTADLAFRVTRRFAEQVGMTRQERGDGGQGGGGMIAAASVQAAVARPAPVQGAPGPVLRLLILLAAVVVVGGAASRGAAAGAIAIAAIGFGLAVLRRPAIGAICLVAVVPAVAGFKRGLPVPGLRLSELLIIGGSALVLAAVPRAERTRWRSIDRIAVAYATTAIVVGLLATALRDAQLSFDDWGQLLGPVQFVLLYRAAVVALDTPRLRRIALDAMLAASIPVSVLAMLQAARFGPVLSLLSWMTGANFADRQGWALERVSGPFPHWTVLGGYEVAVIALAAAVLLNGRRGRSPVIAIAALALGSIALTLTVTIGSILGAIVAVVLLARWSNRLLLVGGVLALAGVIAGLAFAPLLHARAEEQFAPTASRSSLPLVPSTVAARYDYWTQQYLPALRGHWLTGYGPQIPDSVQWRFTESVYLAMIMRGGLPLLVLYLVLMWAAALVAWRSAGAEDDTERTAARVVFVLVVALALMQITAPQFVLTGLPHLWWGLLGVLGAATAGRPSRAPGGR